MEEVCMIENIDVILDEVSKAISSINNKVVENYK